VISPAGARINPSTTPRVVTIRRTALRNSAGAFSRVFNGAVLVSALWHPGPQMLDQMQATKLAWPRFDGMDMANLIAYLNSLPGGK
jgi:hypothetical protein